MVGLHIFYIISTAGRFLRTQHVRRGGRRKLSQMPRESRTRGEGAARTQTRQEDSTQTKKSATFNDCVIA